MIRLPKDAPDEAILRAMCDWVDLLAQQDYVAATEYFAADPQHAWSAAKLEEAINLYAGQAVNGSGRVLPLDRSLCLRAARGQDDTCPILVVRPELAAPPATVLPSGRMTGSLQSLVTARHQQNPAQLGKVEIDLRFDGLDCPVTATLSMLEREGQMVFTLGAIYIQ